MCCIVLGCVLWCGVVCYVLWLDCGVCWKDAGNEGGGKKKRMSREEEEGITECRIVERDMCEELVMDNSGW